MTDSTSAVQSTTPHDDPILQAAMRSVACMMNGREPVFPMEVTVTDPHGLIGRFRLRKVGGETQAEVLDLGNDSDDSDAPTFPVMMCAVDAAGAKFSCAMYEDMSPVATS